MGKENIEKYSARYALLKSIAGFWHNNIFYRKVIVLGRENINPEDSNIFAPNHQNALMDALAVLFTQKGQPVFLARSDMFKRKLVASIMYFLKILPVYRIRDGFSTLKLNDEIFDKTVDVIRNKNGLVILPEGNHEGFRRLRQLKKGIFRIAFQADEAIDPGQKIKIIPVGLEFTNYSRFRQVLTVVYGEPIEVCDYIEHYRENPEKAMNELRSRLSAEMRNIMIHIESEEDYEAIDELRSIINGKYSDDIRKPKIFRDQELIEKLNKLANSDHDRYKQICSLALNVKRKTRDLDLSYRLLEKKKHPLLGLLLGSIGLIVTHPLFIYGNIFNLTFLALPNLHIPKIKDPQFHSSIKYGLSLALAFVFLPLYLILCLIIFHPWWLAILIFATLPLSGLFAWNYFLELGRIKGGFRIRNLISTKNRKFQLLKAEYRELIEMVSHLR
jgi:1-acyl-sn-glycerol-3-phosphate acyltransferase